jgi:benzoyl-CoA reductase subunit BamC
MFKEPDSGLPLKCDMCEGEDEPLCVQWCLTDVLVYEEREVWVDEETEGKKQEELDIGLESLADKYGLDQLKDAMARMTTKE